MNPHLIIPTGTQVVVRRAVATGAGVPICPAGAVGVVVGAPADASHAYRVRLPDGAEVSLKRQELSIRKQAQAGEIGDPSAVLREHDLYEHVVYRCIVGSRRIRAGERRVRRGRARCVPAAGRAALVALRRARAAGGP